MHQEKRQKKGYDILFWGGIVLLVLIFLLVYWKMDAAAVERASIWQNIAEAKEKRDGQEREIANLNAAIRNLNLQKEQNSADQTDQQLVRLQEAVRQANEEYDNLKQQYDDLIRESQEKQQLSEHLSERADQLEQQVLEKRKAEEESRRASEEESRRAEESQSSGIDLNAYYDLNRFENRDYSKVVYLTFDDGPSTMTPKVLDILDQYQIKATFFVAYKTSPLHVPYYKQIVDRGHAIGVHTASHDYNYIYVNMTQFEQDFNQIYNWIVQQTGVHTTLYRFPGGSKTSYNAAIREDIKAFLAQRGMMYYDWNVANGDGGTVTADEAYHNVVDNIQRISHPIILMHDTKQTTVDALPRILQTLIDWGYTFEVITPQVRPVWQGVR